MRFLVHPPSRDSVRLERSGPGGKGKITATYRAARRWVNIPDTACAVYAEAVSALIKAGTLIVPSHVDAPPAVLPGLAPLRHKVKPEAPAPEAEITITEADVEPIADFSEPVIDVVSGDAPEETSTRPSKRRRH